MPLNRVAVCHRRTVSLQGSLAGQKFRQTSQPNQDQDQETRTENGVRYSLRHLKQAFENVQEMYFFRFVR
jgi:hypothetical protein